MLDPPSPRRAFPFLRKMKKVMDGPNITYQHVSVSGDLQVISATRPTSNVAKEENWIGAAEGTSESMRQKYTHAWTTATKTAAKEKNVITARFSLHTLRGGEPPPVQKISPPVTGWESGSSTNPIFTTPWWESLFFFCFFCFFLVTCPSISIGYYPSSRVIPANINPEPRSGEGLIWGSGITLLRG